MASRRLTNLTTDENLRFNGLKLAPGEEVVVSYPLTPEATALVSKTLLSSVAVADPAALSLHQTFIPVCEDNDNIVGLFAIPNTAFNGTETALALSAGAVPLELYTLPVTATKHRQLQYMRSKFSHVDSVQKRYESYAEFFEYSVFESYHQWQNTGAVQRLDIINGALIDSLIKGSTAVITVTPPSAPSVNTPAQLSLVANAPFANEPGIIYFDFNWVAEFQAVFPTKEPATIIVDTQPAEGDFKAFVMGNAQPVAGMITNNTVRIVKTKKGNVPTGTRNFTFTIVDHLGNETPVALVVTIS